LIWAKSIRLKESYVGAGNYAWAARPFYYRSWTVRRNELRTPYRLTQS